MTLLRNDFDEVSYALPASQREELADYIYFLQEHNGTVKTDIALQGLILRHSSGSINWPDVLISKFKNTQSSCFLPEGEQKQLYLFQILRDLAKDVGHGEPVLAPPSRYETLDPELYRELFKIFGGNDAKYKLSPITLSDFINEFKDNSAQKINIDRVRAFIKAEGKEPHKFPIIVRDALLDFTHKYNSGEIRIRPNILTNPAKTLEPA